MFDPTFNKNKDSFKIIIRIKKNYKVTILEYFFVDENDRHVTVNGERYRAMLEDYLWPELDELDIDDMWFQQDGATQHASQSIYSKANSVNVLSREMVRSNGRLVHAI